MLFHSFSHFNKSILINKIIMWMISNAYTYISERTILIYFHRFEHYICLRKLKTVSHDRKLRCGHILEPAIFTHCVQNNWQMSCTLYHTPDEFQSICNTCLKKSWTIPYSHWVTWLMFGIQLVLSSWLDCQIIILQPKFHSFLFLDRWKLCVSVHVLAF